ncbi:hypothetical protein [Leifsonia tongyongensis]|nr:hypothetical protein [Diaminobutyricibacter tongyongensis]
MPGLVQFVVNWIAASCVMAGIGLWYRSDPVFDYKNHEDEL